MDTTGTLTLTVCNWEKYNPRGDVKNSRWFRFDHSVVDSPEFFEFTHAEFRAFVYLLSLASRKNSEHITVHLEYAFNTTRLTREEILSAIQKLEALQIVHVDGTRTYRGRTAHVPRTSRGRTAHVALRDGTVRDGTGRDETNVARIGIRAKYAPEFEKVWEAYEGIGKKSDAYKAFKDLKLKDPEYQLLLEAIPKYLADCKAKDRKQMYFGTFLREDWRVYAELAGAAPKELHSDLKTISPEESTYAS